MCMYEGEKRGSEIKVKNIERERKGERKGEREKERKKEKMYNFANAVYAREALKS